MTTITITDGNLGQQATTKDMVSALFYNASVAVYESDLAPMYPNVTVIRDYKTVKTSYDAQSTEHKELWADWLFQIKSFFDTNIDGVLYVVQQLNTGTPVFPTTAESWITSMLNESGGEIRNFGFIVKDLPFDIAHVTTLNNIAEAYTSTEFCPFSIWYQCYVEDTFPNLRDAGAKRVSVCIGSVGEFTRYGLGYVLGMKSKRKVHESVGWIEQSRLPIAVSEPIALADIGDVRYIANSQLEELHDKGYTYIRTYKAYPGLYVNNAPVCAAITSDFAFSQYVSTIDKAFRLLREYILPAENSPVEVDAEGKLSENTLSYFRSKASKAMEQMRVAGEIVSFRDITVTWNGPTETITINVAILRKNTAAYINVNLGFTL